ncbi:Putative auto-transporter adhesin, head GIN domain [Filimonas lacunae]|uniref:Putative auto-transporter adhesin, head GIN domain n=1 Tax=Filimonas lacunae TaxID=477680 RepID=A0A173MKV0_9BACT|nr:head GIN domain-containing protein [Filimonas lacunae]BAV08272.1 hypothetical protein FLA_4308 [Filimonas lacunae]SIT33216.1 Putative auto-transporter adhesin, head GIN domain [Filimonas lacunae]
MKLKLVALLGIFCLVAGCDITAQETIVHDANAQVRTVGAFTGVEVGGAMVVYISQGKTQAVAVSASDEKYVAKIKTEVKNGVLYIHPESGAWNGWNWGNKNIKAYVTVTELNNLEVNGASTVQVSGSIHVKQLNMEVSGASSFKGALAGSSINLEATGASSVTVSGSVDVFNVEASGASSVKGYDLTTATCNAEASGASGISITVTKELSAEASGASSIGYKGSAVAKNIETSGASSIKRKD